MRRSRPLLGLAFSMLLLGAVEGLCRVLPAGDSELPRAIRLEPHPTRIWALGPPGAGVEGSPVYQLDDAGLRAPFRVGSDRAPLLLTLGDSSIFGDGLPDGETLSDQLQSTLSGMGSHVRTRNGGVPGYSTLQSRVLMEEVGWGLQPDLLVIGSLWSDCSQDLWRDEEMLALMQSPAARFERSLARSALFSRVREGVNQALGRPTAWRISWPKPGDKGRRRVSVADYADNLSRLLDDAEARKVGVLFLTLADRSQLEGGSEKTGCSPYVQVQQQLAAGRRVPIVDARAAYLDSGISARELLWDELHPAATGARVLARAIAATLAAEGWPKTRLTPGPTRPLKLPDDPEDGNVAAQPESVQREFGAQ